MEEAKENIGKEKKEQGNERGRLERKEGGNEGKTTIRELLLFANKIYLKLI